MFWDGYARLAVYQATVQKFCAQVRIQGIGSGHRPRKVRAVLAVLPMPDAALELPLVKLL